MVRHLFSFVFFQAARGDCYGADTTSFYWCQGYASAGYSCKGSSCASATCVGDCTVCAQHYPDAVLDQSSGRCCDSLADDGACQGPKDGLAKTGNYDFPDHKPTLIFEGTSPITNGAPVWSDDVRDGAYGFSAMFPPGSRDKDCPVAPQGFDADKVHTWSFRRHNVPTDHCALTCDINEIERTGVDPCVSGSRPDIPIKMACYSGGDMWLTPGRHGVCAYPCTSHHIETKEFCGQADLDKHECFLVCDPRNLMTQGAQVNGTIVPTGHKTPLLV